MTALGRGRLQKVFPKGVKSDLGPGEWMEVSQILRKENALIQKYTFECEQLHFERVNTVVNQKYKPNWFMHTSDHAGLSGRVRMAIGAVIEW